MNRDAHAAGPTLQTSRASALVALLLLVPAPSIGTTLAMVVSATEATWVGQGAYLLSKLWLVLLPAAWLLWVDRGQLSFSPPRKGGFGAGIGLGLLLSLGVYAAYFLLGPQLIDPGQVRGSALQAGIGTPVRYLLFAIYLSSVNSVLEEYVWRWFVFRKCEVLLPQAGGWAAVVLSAALFTLHHVIALRAQLDWDAAILASLGVFMAGLAWSWCYLRYRSIWPAYVSHLIVDITILWIGWTLIFGS